MSRAADSIIQPSPTARDLTRTINFLSVLSLWKYILLAIQNKACKLYLILALRSEPQTVFRCHDYSPAGNLSQLYQHGNRNNETGRPCTSMVRQESCNQVKWMLKPRRKSLYKVLNKPGPSSDEDWVPGPETIDALESSKVL